MLLRISAILIVAFVYVTAFAQTPRDMQQESLFCDQLKAIAPDAVEDFKAGTVAIDNDNYDEALRLYQAVEKRAPKFEPVMRRLGWLLVRQGKTDEGFKLLEDAVAQTRSPESLLALAAALAYPNEKKDGTIEQKGRAYELVKEAMRRPITGDDGDYHILLGQLALDFNDLETFRRSTKNLSAKHPELMVSHYFSAILAANDEQWFKAEREIRKAESLGLPPQAVQQFLDSGVHTRVLMWRYSLGAGVLVAAWAIGLLALFGLGRVMSRRTLRSIETSDSASMASATDMSLRKWYKRLIALAGVYYYISLPVVIVLVIAFAIFATYLAFALGYIPIKLLFLIDAGALITSYKMVRSLFLKIEAEDPGRPLTLDDAPGLWDLTRNVASTLNTRTVDEIRVTPGTDLSVYEKGTWREKSSDRARRILVLGVGVLNGFELNAFRAVLAHEYGHFSHRDTAGGEVALRVNGDMFKFARAMILSGQNVWWNPAFHFLRIYDFIFRRISHGATRLQEILADRVAAARYGAQSFEEGLKHVIRKSCEFRVLANRELGESANLGRALQNLYELSPSAEDNLDQVINESLRRKTTEDDTHPSPNDRFELTRRVPSQTEPPISGMVWDLFKDRAGLTNEMTLFVQSQMRR